MGSSLSMAVPSYWPSASLRTDVDVIDASQSRAWGLARSAAYAVTPTTACTERTALAPSPTAAATRFIEPWRTSPTAKTHGTLVSKGLPLLAASSDAHWTLHLEEARARGAGRARSRGGSSSSIAGAGDSIRR